LGLQSNKAKYALLAARYGGLNYLFTETKQRIYRKETFIGLVKDLNENDIEIKSKIDYSLRLASPDDIDEILDFIKYEGKEAIFELIQRKWFYDSGFHNCYIARTRMNNDLCYMQWTISWQDENAGSPDFKSSFPWLEEQEMQLEHAYTFTRYRGNRIMPAVMNDLFQIGREKGLKRVISYVLADNTASLKGCRSVGFKDFRIVQRTKLPFLTRYKITPSSMNQ
jgi:hypothetical protein